MQPQGRNSPEPALMRFAKENVIDKMLMRVDSMMKMIKIPLKLDANLKQSLVFPNLLKDIK